MQNLSEFSKLFKVKIPVEKHWEYYLGLLRQSSEFCDLDKWILAYEEIESKYPSVYEYKKGILEQLKNLLSSSPDYKAFNSAVLPNVAIKSFKQNKTYDHFISIDLVQANWNIIQCFSPVHYTWEEFFSLTVGSEHKALLMSKSFRQVIFGNLNPNRNSTYQKMFMSDLASVLVSDGYDVGLNADEIIISVPREKIIPVLRDLRNKLLWIKTGEYDSHFILGPDFTRKLGYKMTVYSLNGKIKTVYDNVDQDEAFLKEKYKTLVGVPGNEFYMYFKAFILGQEIEERDCLFEVDGRLAKWIELPNVFAGTRS